MSGVQLNKIWTGKLGEVLPIKYGKSLPAKLRDASGNVPVYGSSGRVGVHSEAITQGPALIVGRKGSVGSVYFSNEPCWPIDTAYYTEAVEGQDIRYFKYLLDSLHLKRLDKSTAIPGLSRDDYNALTVAIAPIEEQRKIVAEIEKQFSRLDEAVANLKRVKANLKRYKAAVLKAAVEGRLLTSELELQCRTVSAVETGKALLSKVRIMCREIAASEGATTLQKTTATLKEIDSALPNLPHGWTWVIVAQVGRLQLGRQRSPKYHNGPNMRPYLRVQNVFEARLDLSDVMEMEFSDADFERFALRPGDVLLNEGQSPEFLGRPALYRGELPGACFTNTLIRFQAYPCVLPEYALIVFRHHMRSGRFVKESNITTNIAHLSLGRLSTVEFPLPPLPEQRQIVDEVERRFTLTEAIESQVEANLKRSRRLQSAVLSVTFDSDPCEVADRGRV